MSGIVGRQSVDLLQVKASRITFASSFKVEQYIPPQQKMGALEVMMTRFPGEPGRITCNTGDTLP